MLYKVIASYFAPNPLVDLGRYKNMNDKEINAHDMNELLPSIEKYLERYEINVSKMCKDIGIPRSTFYDFLYTGSKDLNRIQKLITYLGLEISIKPTRE